MTTMTITASILPLRSNDRETLAPLAAIAVGAVLVGSAVTHANPLTIANDSGGTGPGLIEVAAEPFPKIEITGAAFPDHRILQPGERLVIHFDGADRGAVG